MELSFLRCLNGIQGCACIVILKVGRIINFPGRAEFTLAFGDFNVEMTVPADHVAFEAEMSKL
ncbi:MAG: hypothetical protein IPP89_00475 [Saprospiraceae bacterium]|nr:hypothetical protein [Candidatus Brachybacter algidus]MBL0117484.1 hypothetical protein [Candidatus Brachybacter algidus]